MNKTRRRKARARRKAAALLPWRRFAKTFRPPLWHFASNPSLPSWIGIYFGKGDASSYIVIDEVGNVTPEMYAKYTERKQLAWDALRQRMAAGPLVLK